SIPVEVDAQIAVKDNADNAGFGAGQFVYYTQGGGDAIPETFDGVIASGQAFWVRTSATTDITFQEDDKADVSNPQFMRAKPVKDRLRINITGNNRQDEIIIRFSEDATDYADRSFDAYKMRNDYI